MVPGVTSGKVTGGGHLGKGVVFGFNVNADSITTKKIKGSLEYHDMSSKIILHSNNMTSLSIDQNNAHASFSGKAKVNGTSGLTFTISVINADKKSGHGAFSITISDGSGKVIYQNSGKVKGGHIEIHATQKDNSHDVKQVHEKSDDKNGKEKQHLLTKPNLKVNDPKRED